MEEGYSETQFLSDDQQRQQWETQLRAETFVVKSGPTVATTCDTSLGSSVDPGVAPTKDASGSHQAPLGALHERNGGDQVTATGAGEGTTWNDHGPEEMAGWSGEIWLSPVNATLW